MIRALLLTVALASAACRAAPPSPGQRSGPTVAGLEGAALYARYCTSCHGAQGGGDGVNAPNLDPRPRLHRDPAWSRSRSDSALAAAIRDGRGRAMPRFGRTLKPHEIADLVAGLREIAEKGNRP